MGAQLCLLRDPRADYLPVLGYAVKRTAQNATSSSPHCLMPSQCCSLHLLTQEYRSRRLRSLPRSFPALLMPAPEDFSAPVSPCRTPCIFLAPSALLRCFQRCCVHLFFRMAIPAFFAISDTVTGLSPEITFTSTPRLEK